MSITSKIPYLPQRLRGLEFIATNVTWRLSRDAHALFREIDETLWRMTRHNAIELLQRVDPARLAACARDPRFLARFDAIEARVNRAAQGNGTWFAEEYPDLVGSPVVYFCAEFGLHNSVPIYSGGLGVLAGDHLKAASDLGVPLVAVGLLYSKGYFDQKVDLHGWQQDSDEVFDPSVTPLERLTGPKGEPFLATVQARGRTIHVAAWRIMVGRVPLFLLDTNLEENAPEDRELTQRLYGGGQELRLLQEWILGVGGVRVLRSIGVAPSVWHANEGHAAFMMVERVRELLAEDVSFEEAVGRVRSTSMFTTHTPVPAGHDMFAPEQVEGVLGPVWEEVGVDRETFMRFGSHPVMNHGLFHMTVTAMRLSSQVNGVSERHGLETREIWKEMWPERPVDRIPIRHVTNGVHLGTWMAHPILELLDNHLGEGWQDQMENPEIWDRVLTLDPVRFWYTHRRLKQTLLDFVREEARLRWLGHWKEAVHLVGAGTLLSAAPLTIGFARRFASYKRADLLFRDPDRLRRILTNPWRPVQLIFAGKAHPADQPGKEVLQRVYSHTRDPRFEGRIAFLEDYEMHVAHRMVQGVDVWMNLPRVPLEASGTSGMKAALNGVPQISTLDGWWAEGYTGENGWSIPHTPPGEDMDTHDAEQLYTILEQMVVPLFYDVNEEGIPLRWVERMKNAMWVAGARFTTRRMLRDYTNDYYVPAIRGDISPDDPPTV